MTREFEYRVKQIDSLAKKVATAPFTPRDMEMVYQIRYKPTIKYALPVTLFNANQLKRIQQKFINSYLPRVCINRHTPRAIVFCPKTHGGMGVMDLTVKQPIQALILNTMIGHLRRKDDVGKMIRATLNNTQIEVGLPHPFFTYNSDKINYCTKNTRWHYIWKFTNDTGLDLKVENMWTLTSQQEGDKNIMEIAIKDTYFHQKYGWKLEVINNCRMYLGVFYLSEIMNDNGRVERKYLDGSDRVTKHRDLFQDRRNPPKQAWSEWKAFIFYNFLINGYEVFPALGLGPRNEGTVVKYESKKQQLVNIQKGQKLEEIISMMPQVFKELLQILHIPIDDGKRLVKALIDGTLVGASDGSLMKTA